MRPSSHLLLLFGPGALCAATFHPGLQCEIPAYLDQQPACTPISTATTLTDEELYRGQTWRRPPVCFQNTGRTYCTHTLPARHPDRSLSIVGTPEAARGALEIRKRPQRVRGFLRKSWYEIRDLPGKGKGVIAKRWIKKGDVIMLDSPGIIASAQVPMHVSPSEGSRLFQSAITMLDDLTRQEVLALDGHGDTDINGILEKNAFSCQFGDGGTGDDYLCLFPEVSRINHACRPNANAKFSSRMLSMEIRALQDIAPGEEISISYGKVELKHSERQSLYSANWGFACSCDLCTASKSAIAESDWRRERFGQLHEMLVSLTAESYNVERVLGWEKEILAISEVEGFESLIMEDMERMAYVYAGLGHIAEAVLWAQKAKENLLLWKISSGNDSDDLKRVEELLKELGVD